MLTRLWLCFLYCALLGSQTRFANAQSHSSVGLCNQEESSYNVEGILTDTSSITDMLTTPSALFVASWGGVEEFDLGSLQLIRRYSTLNGLDESQVLSLHRSGHGPLVAETTDSSCTLRGTQFSCTARTAPLPRAPLSMIFEGGTRVTVHKSENGLRLLGTSNHGAFVNGRPLGSSALPGPHVTALAVRGGDLYVGTFNAGLVRLDERLDPLPVRSPSAWINALVTGPAHLFVGTSEGLFRSQDGVTFERIDFVEQAVVGLTFDGTSIWASTQGALYRIRDGVGPASDVWWLPGGSRSLQKISSTPGNVWLATEDRGVVHLKTSPHLVARDRPFVGHDLATGLHTSWSLSVAARQDGSALVTSLRDGLAWLTDSGEFRQIPSPNISPWGLSTLDDECGVWVGTQGGAALYQEATDTLRSILGLPNSHVHVFLRDTRARFGSRLWVGTENGLAWLNVDSEAGHPPGKPL